MGGGGGGTLGSPSQNLENYDVIITIHQNPSQGSYFSGGGGGGPDPSTRV